MKIYTEAELKGMCFPPITTPGGVVRVKDEETATRLGLDSTKDYKVSFVGSAGTGYYGKSIHNSKATVSRRDVMEHHIDLEGVEGGFPLHEFAIVDSGFLSDD